MDKELKEGTKNDQGKPGMHFLDGEWLEEVAKVMDFGAIKYEPNNWRKGILFSRVFGAAMRHLWKWWRGHDSDEETGLNHLAHASCCIMFLFWYSKYRKELDDRYVEPK